MSNTARRNSKDPLIKPVSTVGLGTEDEILEMFLDIEPANDRVESVVKKHPIGVQLLDLLSFISYIRLAG